jgi:hypothetical protein
MAAASKSFGDAFKAVYEPEWPHSDETYGSIEVRQAPAAARRCLSPTAADIFFLPFKAIDHLYQDVLEKTQEQVVATLQSYVARFPDIKARIAKRERRALDYERTKRALEKAREGQVRGSAREKASSSLPPSPPPFCRALRQA